MPDLCRMNELLRPGMPFPDPFPKGATILIDKPLGWTSFDVVNKVRFLLSRRLGLKSKKFRVGHAGTLDPLATGLLVICTGDHTKRIEALQTMPKTYTGVMTFGATTASYDLEKAVQDITSTEQLTDDKLQAALSAFRGEIQQMPPVFSAVKVDGQRLYKNARTGETVDMPFRPVRVDAFQMGPLRPAPTGGLTEKQAISERGAVIYRHPEHSAGKQADFEITCGKGTYIRSLASDLGQAVGTGAYLSSLRRTQCSGYNIEDAWQIAGLEAWINGAGQSV